MFSTTWQQCCTGSPSPPLENPPMKENRQSHSFLRYPRETDNFPVKRLVKLVSTSARRQFNSVVYTKLEDTKYLNSASDEAFIYVSNFCTRPEKLLSTLNSLQSIKRTY